MDKRLVGLFMLSIFMFSIISFANAEIFLKEQPRDTYTYGDQLNIVLGSDGSEGWTNIGIVCSNSSKDIYFHYLTEDQTSIDISVPLTKSFLRDLKGECFLSLEFNNDVKESLPFQILDSISFDILFNKNVFEPNETIFFTGTTSKITGVQVQGFAEISFSQNELETIVPIIDDEFTGNISLPINIPGGEYLMEVFVYEKNDAGEITNFGFSNDSISVLQKSKILELKVDDEIDPDSDLEFVAQLYDQAGSTIDFVPVAFNLIDPSGEVVLNILANTGETNYYKIKRDALVGYWNLSAESNGVIASTRLIYVNINKEASFDLINNTLIIRNVGNVHYDKLVEIGIGNYSEVKNINLTLGESLEFELNAPDGNYTISVSDGSLDATGIATLTGDAIRIRGAKRGVVGFFSRNIFAWVFIIGVLGLFIFVSSKRILNKKMVLFNKDFSMKPKFKKEEKGGVVKITPGKDEDSINISKGDEVAHHSLVIKGEKQVASLIALKIKNQDEIDRSKSNAKESINEAVNLITESHGRVYKAGEYMVGIFTPSITRTFDNSLISIKVADKIVSKLKEHNAKYKQKIEFGIGIDEGVIIAKKEHNKLLFTPLGSSLSMAKKIADMSKNDLLLSEQIQLKIKSKVKTITNPKKFGIRTYSINEILDREQNAKFINRFLHRNEYKKLDDFKV